MPYRWSEDPTRPHTRRLTLWPHSSLSPKGFAAFMLTFFTMAAIPLIGFLGTFVLWGLLPFMLTATGGIYYALRRNDRDRQILEELTLSPRTTTLSRKNPRKKDQFWETNSYWLRVYLHETGGPVPYYVTLKGDGREVEIGAFLSEDERKALHDDLSRALARLAQQDGD